jgi:predicted DNA-binding transcriptional regulator YafY
MPRIKKSSDDFGKTGLARLRRQWHLLTLVPKYGRQPTTIAALAERLHDIHDPNLKREHFLRKIQHDLEQLSVIIPELKVDKFDGVFWDKSGPPIGLGLSPDETLAFGVLKKLGVEWMPGVMQKALEPYFKMAMTEAAQQVVERFGYTFKKSENKAKKWLDRVERLPDWIGFRRPRIDLDVEKVVHEALLYEGSVEIDYGSSKKIVHPQAIVQKGVRTYLLATRESDPELRTYLMSRVKSAKPITSSSFKLVDPSIIKKHLDSGIAFREMPLNLYGKEIRLKLWVDAGTAKWLTETPLGEDQTIKPLSREFARNNPWSEIEVTVFFQEELVWWLRSMGSNVQVVAPKFLRDRVYQDLISTLEAYK